MYNYYAEKPKIFTEENQDMFLKIRDNVYRLCKLAGAVTMGSAWGGCTGDSWVMMACVDRLVELGEIFEIQQVEYLPGQHRIFCINRHRTYY